MQAAPPPTLDGFRDLRLIGDGSFASVYRATEDLTYRDVAIKLLHPLVGDLDRRSFLTEAAALGKVSAHPNIVCLHRATSGSGGPTYLVMEFVDGGDLAGLITRQGALSWRDARPILLPLLLAIEFAHGNRILHCDLKPGNVLLRRDRTPILTDFGVSRFVGATAQPATSLGAWSYTAPECLAGAAPTTQSDLYGIGAIAFALLTGAPPVDLRGSTNPSEASARRARAVVPALPESLPVPVRSVLEALIEVEPERRPVSARTAARALGANGAAPAHEAQHIDPTAFGSFNKWWRES